MFHVVISQELRANPLRHTTINPVDQMHTLGDSVNMNNLSNPNIIYAAEWDGVSDKLNVVKGDPALLDMRYAGWPEA